MNPWLLENLVCPQDKESLCLEATTLTCPQGHHYPVVDGVPVMLISGIDQTLHVAESSLAAANHSSKWYLESVGLSQEQIAEASSAIATSRHKIDPLVAYLVAATNGIAYKHLVGNLDTYPIPDLRLTHGNGKTFLDIGCNWGRWCVAAARNGFKPIGIDPSLGAVMTARRVARSLGIDALFIVGDGRYLPLRSGCIDTVFSYSVLQHFSRDDAALVVAEVSRTLKEGGECLIQMPTVFGIRCLYHQARRKFKEATHFDVRYWTIPALKRMFRSVGTQPKVSVDCYFGIGLQPADLPLMPLSHKVAILTSELLRALSRWVAPLRYLADSVYICARKQSLISQSHLN